MAVIAGNGGLIPWHSGIATSFGRFQIVLGREMGVYFFAEQNPAMLYLVFHKMNKVLKDTLFFHIDLHSLSFQFLSIVLFVHSQQTRAAAF